MVTLPKPRICKLNRNSPLINGLVFCVPGDEGSGPPRDIITDQQAVIVGPSPPLPNWVSQARYGPAPSNNFVSGAGRFSYGFNNNPAFEVPTTCTIGCFAIQNAWPASGDTKALVSVDTNFDFTANNSAGQGNNWLSVQCWDGAGNIKRVGVTTFPSLNVWHCYVGWIVGGQPSRIYIDGIQQTTSTNSSAGTRATTGILYYASTSAFTANWGNPMEMLCLWNRQLTPPEINLFTNDPYSMFVAPSNSRSGNLISGAVRKRRLLIIDTGR